MGGPKKDSLDWSARLHADMVSSKSIAEMIVSMRYTAIADDVRNGKAGKLPNDKLIQPKNASGGDMNGYVNGGFSSSNDEEEIPFD